MYALYRLHLCQTGPGSAGTREFVKSMYATIKLANPGFPFLIREAEGTSAKITGRYGAQFIFTCLDYRISGKQVSCLFVVTAAKPKSTVQ